MTIVLTGASGLVGRAVLQALCAAGIDDVLPAGRHGQPIVLDLAAATVELPSGTTVVLHLAAEKRDAASMRAVNAEGAERLVDAAARAGARAFVHLSSVGVYGARKHAGVVTETSPHAPRNPYELTKDEGERRVRARCGTLGVRCTVLQPSNIVGVQPGQTPLLGLVRAIGRGRYFHFGPPRAWVNYVAVEDVAVALVAALKGAASGTWIVNTPCLLEDLIAWIADELGCSMPRARLPLWLGAAAAGAGAAMRALLQREVPFSPERFREMTSTTRFDGRRIEQDLSFTYPVGIERAARRLAASYRDANLA